jgi:hypothetical protein
LERRAPAIQPSQRLAGEEILPCDGLRNLRRADQRAEAVGDTGDIPVTLRNSIRRLTKVP